MNDEDARIDQSAKDGGVVGTSSGQKCGTGGSNANDFQQHRSASQGKLEEQEGGRTPAPVQRRSSGGTSRPAGSTTPKSPLQKVGVRLR